MRPHIEQFNALALLSPFRSWLDMIFGKDTLKTVASYRLMRVLRPVVCSQAPIVLSRERDRAERCRIGSQPVGHNPARRKALLLKQFHHEFLCSLCISSALDEEIQHFTLVIDRPPEPVFTAADRNYHFIEVPMIARPRPRTADIRRDRRPELQ